MWCGGQKVLCLGHMQLAPLLRTFGGGGGAWSIRGQQARIALALWWGWGAAVRSAWFCTADLPNCSPPLVSQKNPAPCSKLLKSHAKQTPKPTRLISKAVLHNFKYKFSLTASQNTLRTGSRQFEHSTCQELCVWARLTCSLRMCQL